MNAKFVVLSALAVSAIYTTGYAVSANAGVNTPPAATSQTATGSAQAQTQGHAKTSSHTSSTSSRSGQSGQGSSKSGTSGSASSKQASQSSSTSTKAQQQYLDGTYNGSASNQIGTVAVAVTVKSGKITDVQITACDTHYPQAYIDPVLPDYVVSNQTTQIPVVSGATLSTEDFYYAVVQALSQAQNPNYKG